MTYGIDINGQELTEAEVTVLKASGKRFDVKDGQRVQFTAGEETARDIKDQAWASGEVARNAAKEIARLESTITPRRLRDALANDAGKAWVAAVEALIATERGKL